ncbi:MAG: ATP-binding protein [Epsilonproteobacteria bacterium]|nr:ATP-binding protein [Campylobacterota bacterium]
MKKLPIGIQTFKEIRNENYIYIDKTKEAYELITNYKYVFLSRPRRFGKSLFLDTLRNIFEGNKKLFNGLYIYDKWEFEKYPVIKIDWVGDFKSKEKTEKRAKEILAFNQENLDIECNFDGTSEGCLEELIQKTYKKYQKKVVVLIDEYDKPILDNIENPEIAKENRDFLRGFYGIFKANDEFLKFVFLTGITKFSKASIFSGLNMLEDISLNPDFGNICGYTQENLEVNFKEFFESSNVNMELVKRWYNGYYFLKNKIYNPFDILQFIKNKFVFKNYWWESGNPYFLLELLKKENYNIPKLENITVGSEILNSFDIEKLRLEVLLYQAGYLTIEKAINTPIGVRYKLKIPNLEIQISLNELFLLYFTNNTYEEDRLSLYEALSEANLEKFKVILTSLFASIPYNNYVKNEIGEYEGYYSSVMYSFLAGSGLDIVAEDVTNAGRIDLTIKIGNYIYIIEFKVMENEESEKLKVKNEKCEALGQIKEKRYYEKYMSEGKEIYLIGVCFDKSKKNISYFEWEKI